MWKALPMLAVVLLQSTPAPRVVYAYRELLAGYAMQDREAGCMGANGPFQLLDRHTAPADAAQVARRLDAARVPELVNSGLRRASALLPGIAVSVCVFAGENAGALPYLGGVGGVSLGGGRIKLFLHPAPQQLRRVEYTVAHEYHHEAERVLRPNAYRDALDTLVREGKADHFAVSLLPTMRPPHTDPLTPGDLAATWQRLVDMQQTGGPANSDFMIGRFPDGLRWPGYRLGYQMVSEFAESPRRSALLLAQTEPVEIAAWFAGARRLPKLANSR